MVPESRAKTYEHVIHLFQGESTAEEFLEGLVDNIKMPFSTHIWHTVPIDNRRAKEDPEGSGLTELRKMVIKAAMEGDYFKEKKPIKWSVLADALEQKMITLLKEDKDPQITLSDMKSVAKNSGITGEEEIRTFLHFHHNLGDLIYFGDNHLRETVILSPQWLSNVFRHVSVYF